jgi:pyrimidine-nucleoside phosphorylase
LTIENFLEQVKKINICISSINKNIVPADKKIYALRDVTGTVSSMSLIASSVMSKKLASGADKILLDVKYGVGALLKTKEEAIDLAKLMIYIGNSHQKETMALITNMNYPLGNMIGNALEVKEAIEILNNRGNSDLRELCIIISTYMVSMSKSISFSDAGKEVLDSIKSGKAYNKFLEMVNYQKGDISKLYISENVVEVRSNKEGYVNDINALVIGEISMKLGAGRKTKEDSIDSSVGIEIIKHIGSYVKNRDIIAKIYINKTNVDVNEIINAFTIEKEMKDIEKIIYGVIK